MSEEDSRSGRFDGMWLTILIVIGCALSATLAKTAFEMSISLSGILCVGLIAIGRREGYLVGLYNSLSYSILAYSNGLYGEVCLNLLFFVPTGVIGYFMWRRHMKQGRAVEMRQLSWAHRFIVVFVCIACTAGLGWILSQIPSQNTPFVDASTNVLSVVATFLMMWRYKEQWLLYILVNIVTIAMWMLRVASGGEASDLMVLMWSVFLLNAIYGYWRWNKGAKMTANDRACPDTKGATCDAA